MSSSSNSSSTPDSRQHPPTVTDDTSSSGQSSALGLSGLVRPPKPTNKLTSVPEIMKEIDAHSKSRQWKEMAKLQIEVLNIYRSAYGEAHLSTLSAMFNLAASYAKLKKLTEAQDLYRHVLLLRTRLLGEEHADTLRTMQNMATVCADLGKHLEAAESLQKILRIRQRVLGEGHPDTLSTMHNLAMTYTDAGKLETAEKLYQVVLSLRKQSLGKNHPKTLGTMRGLVLVYQGLGKLKEAKYLCQNLLSRSDIKNGKDNIHSLRSMSALATINRELHDWKEARALEIELLSRRRRFWGNTHPETLTSMKTVALIYREERRWNEAQMLEEEIEWISQSLDAEDHMADSGSLQSRPYTPLIREVNSTALTRVLGNEHPEVIDSLEAEALSHMQEGKWKQAITTLQEVFRLRQKVQGSSHLYTIQTMNNLGLAHLSHQNLDKAAEIFQEVLDLLKQSQHPALEPTLQSSIQQRISTAESYWRQSQFKPTEATGDPMHELAVISKRLSSRAIAGEKSIVTSEVTIPEIMACLTNRGCPDLTRELDRKKLASRPQGTGGYSDVWRGALLDGSSVALKCLRGEEKLLKHATRELYNWAKARHENVLELRGMAIVHDKIAMVSPWMESGDVCQYLDKYPDADRMHICKQVARGLAYLHSLPLPPGNKRRLTGFGILPQIHGDIKASNVFVSGDGTVKVGDFGLAILLCEQSIEFSDTGDHTRGTVRWMAPELFEDESDEVNCNRSLESDVYSLGMTILEIITGKVPFAEIPSVVKVMRAVADNKRKPSLPGDIVALGEQGNRLWGLLNRCWDENPKNRPTAKEVFEEMEAISSCSILI